MLPSASHACGATPLSAVSREAVPGLTVSPAEAGSQAVRQDSLS